MFEYKFKNNFIILLKYIIKYKKKIDLQKKYVNYQSNHSSNNFRYLKMILKFVKRENFQRKLLSSILQKYLTFSKLLSNIFVIIIQPLLIAIIPIF